jgi:hypothetical protein
MWKELTEGLFEELPRNFEDFSFLPHRKHCERFQKDQKINADK